jgi:hypothetical protein
MIRRALRTHARSSRAALVLLVTSLAVPAAASAAEAPTPGWSVTSIATPTNFSSNDHVDEVDGVTVDAAGGTFTLAAHGETTTSLACDAPAATVQAALEALEKIGAGNVTVTGGATGCSETNTTPYVVTFDGSLSGVEIQEFRSDNTALTGNSTKTAVMAEVTKAMPTLDRYKVVATNTGPQTATEVNIRDTLPSDLVATAISYYLVSGGSEHSRSCAVATLTCTVSSIPSFETVALDISVVPKSGAAATVTNMATAEAGSGSNASTNATPNTVNSTTATPFGLNDFSLQTTDEDGGGSSSAAGHPYSLTFSYDTNTVPRELEKSNDKPYEVVASPKNIVVDLPLGLIGNPLATATRCPLSDLNTSKGLAPCPKSSILGYVVIEGEAAAGGEVVGSRYAIASTTPIFNMIPERGYPAEFGIEQLSKSVLLYANVAHTSLGYQLRVSVPGLLKADELHFASLTFFGDPAQVDEVASPDIPETAFVTNPADCASGPLTARIEANSWQHPEEWTSAESITYPSLTGCSLLQFNPTLAMAPSPTSEEGTTQADEPSAYTVDLRVPQTTGFTETATPALRDATVTLPAGVSVSPSAAEGLEGCRETGPEGIDMPVSALHPDEAGEGEEIAADGLAHLAAGHCPAGSTLGTAEVSTPLLPHPLLGHVYLAEPKCGAAGQSACTESSATNGELYGLYIEAAGEGVVIKLPGKVAADPATGRLTASFDENPQLPFEELKLHFDGGPRAPLANPQTCGSYATTSILSAWSGQEVSETSPAFSIDWNGQGGACPSSLPFAPAFSAGTVTASAGAYSPLTVTFSRQDREQDLTGIQVKTPPGLLGMLSHVSLCGEAQANAGSCESASQIGTTTVSAGAGEHPFYLSGRVYLTGPYNGAPFGLSVVVPAVAGPFSLGNVIVRAAIDIDPQTAALTITSGPLPQIIDGVPTRLRTVNVAVNRPEFTFNATNCSAQQIQATISGSGGGSSAAASPYTPSGCAALPFDPSLSASTAPTTSKAYGASLDVKIAQKPGEANIQKVELEIPMALPTRDSTLNKACLEAQFNADPAGCPHGSVIGTAKAVTPALDVPLTGPAILVSHGGAAFPDVEYVLQGQGVTIILDGKTQIKDGVTYSRFETVPDAPISSFETSLPEGPYSILGTNFPASANESTCRVNLVMPTIIVGQNGAQRTQNTRIAPSGCPLTVSVAKTKSEGSILVVTLQASAAGRVRISGAGLKTTTRSVKAGTQTVRVFLTRSGRAKARKRTKVPLTVRLTAGRQAASKTTAVKL